MELERLIKKEVRKKQDNISLIPFSLNYLPLYEKWFNDDLIRKHLSSRTPRSQEDIKNWIESITQSDHLNYSMILYLDKIIGHIAIKKIPEINNSLEIACVIGDREFIGMNIGFVATYKAIDVAFKNNQDIESVFLTRKPNIEKIFFNKLGFKENKKKEITIYSITRQTWEKSKNL